LTKTVDKHESRLEDMDRKFAKMEVSMKKMEEKIVRHEAQARKTNLLFCGIPEDGQDTWAKCRSKVDRVMNKMGLSSDPSQIRVDKVHRLGPPPRVSRGRFMERDLRDTRPRPIIVSFNWYADRDRIWKARGTLRDSNFHLEEDQPAEIEARKYRLMPIYKKAMSLAAYKGRCFLNGDRLTINGTHYSVDTMDQLPEELNPELIATRTQADSTIFFSINSPLSNHHPAKFVVEGTEYLCNEQFYFSKRAEKMGDQPVQDRVMNTDNPREMLRHGRKAKNINNLTEADLEAEEEKIMTHGVREKFSQNKKLKDFLIATGVNKIGESAKNNARWGTGMELAHKDAFNQNLWAKNRLGEILESQRDLFNS
jgi:hypothetical protein